MITKIFVNIPISDLKQSMTFFTQLGFTFEMNFTDDHAACMNLSESIFVMLVTRPLFKTFTTKQIADAKANTEVILGLSADSREKVDEIIASAIKAGGQITNPPVDQDFMYSRSFHDLDGHQWEIIHMNTPA